MAYHLGDGIDFLRALPDASVDGIFTDPPWGRGPDFPGQDAAFDLLQAMFDECPRILRPTGRVLVWIGAGMLDLPIRANRTLDYRWAVFCRFIPNRFRAHYVCSFDIILYFALPGSPYLTPYGPHRFFTQEFISPSIGKWDTGHLTGGRPFLVVKKILSEWFAPGEYVIDPFAGSDTTGYACRELRLLWDSIEINAELYQTGLERHRQGILWEQEEIKDGDKLPTGISRNDDYER